MDIIAEFIDLAVAAGLPADKAGVIETTLRVKWGGDRHWVAKRMVARVHAALLRDWRAGERIPLLMRKYGLSKTAVYRIVRENSRRTP